MAEVPPLLTIAIRCLGGAAVLFAWIWWRGGIASKSRREWRTALIAGAFLFVGCHGLLAWAEQRVSSGEAALFMTGIPLWLVLLDALRTRQAPGGRVLCGLALGVAGVAILSLGGDAWSGTPADRAGLVLSALCWAVGSLVARHGARPGDVVEATAMQLAAGGVLVLLLSLGLGEPSGWNAAQVSPRAVLALGFLTLGGTVLGFGAYTWLLQVTTPAAAGSYAFVNPVIALGLAWMVGDGELSLRVVMAAAVVVSAIIAATAGLPARDPDAASPRAAASAAFLHPPENHGRAAARAAGAAARPGKPGWPIRFARSACGTARPARETPVRGREGNGAEPPGRAGAPTPPRSARPLPSPPP